MLAVEQLGNRTVEGLAQSQIEILKSIPWTLFGPQAGILVREELLSPPARELLEQISSGRSPQCPIGKYDFHRREEGASEKSYYLLSSPTYKDDAHLQIWNVLFPLASERFDKDLHEIAKLPWIPKPGGLSGVALNGPFFVSGSQLSDEQRALLNAHLGTLVSLNNDGFYPDTYVYVADRVGISSDLNNILGAPQIAASIDERRIAFSKLLQRFPWRLASNGQLALSAKEAHEALHHILLESPTSTETSMLPAVRSLVMAPKEATHTDATAFLSFQPSADKYWDTGDFMGQNAAYVAVIDSVLEREKGFLAKFLNPENHKLSAQRAELFREAAAYGFCEGPSKAFCLTNKLLQPHIHSEAGAEVVKKQSEMYEAAALAILQNPKLYGLKKTNPYPIDNIEEWRVSWNYVEQNQGQTRISSSDWRSAPHYFQIKDAIAARNAEKRESAFNSRTEFEQLPLALHFKRDFSEQRDHVVVLRSLVMLTPRQRSLTAAFSPESYYDGSTLPETWKDLEDHLRVKLEAQIDAPLKELGSMPFVPGHAYGRWDIAAADLSAEQREKLDFLRSKTNLIEFDSHCSTYSVYESRRNDTKNIGILPYEIQERLAKGYVTRLPATTAILPQGLEKLPWRINHASSVYILKQRIPESLLAQIPEGIFEKNSNHYEDKYGDCFELSDPSKYSLGKDPAIVATRRDWFKSLAPNARAFLDKQLKSVSALPWKHEPSERCWSIESTELTKKQVDAVRQLPDFCIQSDRNPTRNAFTLSMPEHIYRQMMGEQLLGDVTLG